MTEQTWTEHPDYASLPEAVKASISAKEYSCMGDTERRNLMQDLTMPEVFEDDAE